MILAEQCFLDMVNSPVRNIRARVELYNGSTLLNTFKYTDMLKELTIERVGEQNKFFGFGVCQKANIKVLDKDTLREIIHELSIITGKEVSLEKEEKIINMIVNDKVPNDIEKYI